MGGITFEIKGFTPKELREFYDKMNETIVYISSFTDDNEQTCCLGSYIRSDGLILTNASKVSIQGKRTKLVKVKGPQTGNISVVVDIVYWNFLSDMVLLKDKNSKAEYNHVVLAEDDEIQQGKKLVILTSTAALEKLSQIEDNTVAPKLSQDLATIAFPCDYESGDVERCRYLQHVLPFRGSISTSIVNPVMPLIEMSGMYASDQSVGAPVFNKHGKMVGTYYFSRKYLFSERVPGEFFSKENREKLPRAEYAIHGSTIHNFMKIYDEEHPQNTPSAPVVAEENIE